MKINKYLRALIFGICLFFMILLIDFISKTWFFDLYQLDYMYLVNGVIAVIICCGLERICYDFDPSHTGDVKLKFKLKK